MQSHLYKKISDEVKKLRRQAQIWQQYHGDGEPLSKAWFNAQLFSPTCNTPTDYVVELEQNLEAWGKAISSQPGAQAATAAQLESTAYLEQHIADQLQALHSALVLNRRRFS